MNTFWLAFLTGLTTGGISCLAVQGGLLASSLAQREREQKALLVGTFLLSKLVAYTLLGFALGSLGSTLTISPALQGFMQILVGLFMLTTAARLLNLHPIFRYFIIQPPKSIFKIVRATGKSESFFAPAILGFLTVLIPCGVTQAMMVLAIASGNPLTGAIIMFAFTLGTSPVFFALGITTLKLLEKRLFAGLAAGVIAVLGILSINTGQILQGSAHTLQNYWLAATTNTNTQTTPGKVAGINTEGKQEVTMQILNTSYSASASTLKAGVPTKLNLVTNGVLGCTRAFVIPSLGISKILPETGTDIVEFTPKKTGRLAFTCSMGMYGGEFQVVN